MSIHSHTNDARFDVRPDVRPKRQYINVHVAVLPMAITAITAMMLTSHAAAKPPAPNLSNAEFQQCLSRLQNSNQFASVRSSFARYRPSQPDPSVIQSLNHQPEFQKNVWDYLSALVDAERVQDGVQARRQCANTLS